MALIDRVKFDGPTDVLVWKWPSESLTLGTQLVVNESQEAIFYKGGQALDLFGPGTHTLATANLPLLSKLVNLPFGGATPFAAEVYYVSKAVVPGQRWGTKNPVMLLDPRYRVTVPLRAFGEYAVRVENSREFVVQLVGTSGGARADLTAASLIASPIAACVQQALGDFLVERKISALDLPAHTLELGAHAAGLIGTRYRTFGVELVNFTAESINFDPEDESVRRLRQMLDEAARLEVVGDAYRRNQDFYRVDRQFDVLQGAAEAGGGPAGGVVGAAIGVGMGFGVAGPAGEIARQVMAPQAPTPLRCPRCGTAAPGGAKFCNECGSKFTPDSVSCADCHTENVATARFCARCGRTMAAGKCVKCGATLAQGAKFCSECGETTR